MFADAESVVSRFWYDAFNGRELTLLDDLLTPGFVLYDLGTHQQFDRDELRERLDRVFSMVTTAEAIINEQLVAGDGRVVTRLTLRARRPDSQALARLQRAPGGYDLNFSGSAGGMEFSFRVSDRDGGGTPTLPPPGLSGEWADFNAIGISRLDGERIAETWFLWESLRAEQVLMPSQEWWWPPW